MWNLKNIQKEGLRINKNIRIKKFNEKKLF
jgi:hypothetical protein